jgi:hypothetical protein
MAPPYRCARSQAAPAGAGRQGDTIKIPDHTWTNSRQLSANPAFAQVSATRAMYHQQTKNLLAAVHLF